jgi:hypothetical protein
MSTTSGSTSHRRRAASMKRRALAALGGTDGKTVDTDSKPPAPEVVPI